VTIECVGNGSGRCEKVQKRYRSLYSSGLSIYRMTRPHWPLRHRADSGPGLTGFPILPLREYPAHTKVKDRESKSRRTKERKKERLSTSQKRQTRHQAGCFQKNKKKTKLTDPGPCSDPCNPNPAQRHFSVNHPRSKAINEQNQPQLNKQTRQRNTVAAKTNRCPYWRGAAQISP